MKVALVHDWLLTEGGAEKSFSEIWKLFPGDVYTLFYQEKKMGSLPFSVDKVHTSFLQKLPLSDRYHRYLFPFFPSAIEQFGLLDADLILSSSHAVAKGIRKKKEQLHICYCYTPIRYAWDLKETYLKSFGFLSKALASFLLERVRKWDLEASSRVDEFIAISHYVAKRIKNNYKRDSKVIYPPVLIDQFFIGRQKQNYYVTHARFVPYKRIDLLVEAFNHMPDKKLVIVGEGPEEKNLKAIASRNIEFVGRVEDKVLYQILAEAKAYVFAAEEDFGIGVVEALASGLPVIALKKGGAVEILKENLSGIFFQEPSIASFIEAVSLFEKKEDSFDPLCIQRESRRFSVEVFRKEFYSYIEKVRKEANTLR